MSRSTGRAATTDPALHRREFAALPLASRRAVARAVSRGRPVEDRNLAVHAVFVARRQRRLWRWMWLVGPAIGLTQYGLGWQVVVTAIVASTVTMGLIARYWHGKAVRAEQLNLERVPKRQRRRIVADGT